VTRRPLDLIRGNRALSTYKVSRAWGLIPGCLTLILGSPVLFIGLNLLFYKTPLHTLSCKKNQENQNNCELISSAFLKTKINTFQLYEAELEKCVSCSGDLGNSSRILLLTSNGENLFTEYYTGGDDMSNQQIQREIKSFISSPERKSLSITKDDRLVTFVFGVMETLFGGMVFLVGGLFTWAMSSGKAYRN
jgi:hypothetical protein